MKHLRLVPDSLNIDFLKYRKLFFSIIGVLLLITVVSLITWGLNLGISFTGGISAEIQAPKSMTVPVLRKAVSDLGIRNASVQSLNVAGNPMFLIRIGLSNSTNQSQVIQQLRSGLQPQGVIFQNVQYVGASVGETMKTSAMWAIFFAFIAIFIYLWFRFEWQFSVVGLIALMHDVFITLGFFSVFQIDFSLNTVAALLTIAGYSINDTVVIFDHVRESLMHNRRASLTSVLNTALTKTLGRTLTTSITTLLALLALLIFGGSVLRSFIIALIWGVSIGTFSSITLAVPLLFYIKPNLQKLEETSTYNTNTQ